MDGLVIIRILWASEIASKSTYIPIFNYALIFGTGGSSNAVRYALKQLGIPHATVSRGNLVDFSYLSLTKEDIKQHNLLINTTPLGSLASIDECVNIPYTAIF